MKSSLITLIAILLSVLPCRQANAASSAVKNATVTFVTQKSDKKIHFQPESDSSKGYQEVQPGETLTLPLEKPAYYYYIDTHSKFYTVFVTPGSTTRIIEKDGKVTFEGDNAAINQYIQEHSNVIRVPEAIAPYSHEWQEFQQKEVNRLVTELKASNLPEDFIRIHSLYYQYSYLMQLINGPETMRMFLGKTPELPADFYDDLRKNKYDDAYLLYYPKWFSVLRGDMELREKRGDIEPDHQNFIGKYGALIENEEVRAAFLLRYLEQILNAGYSEDFPTFLSIAKAALTHPDEAYIKHLSELETRYNELRQKYASITRGNTAPAFTGVDINGKSYSSADYAGKVWVLDFWFSGCIPCKAEMPFMEKLAEEFKGQDIQFFALSLDSGDQMINAWKALVKDKTGPTLELNIPGGFKSELAKHFGVRSVPRIVIIDQQGKIVDAFARRPSDPKLRQQLLGLVGQTSAPTITKEEATATMMAVSQAETAAEKEEIMKAFMEKATREKAEFAYPMINMMLSLTIQALYLEGQIEKADKYVKQLKESAFKRDLLFISGLKCYENKKMELAEKLIGESAQMTLRMNEGKPLSKDEEQKYSSIFGAYAEVLVKNNHIAEAVPHAKLAYKYSRDKSFDFNQAYAAVLIYEKNYEEATPILEDFVKNGMSKDQHIAWLKEAYTAKNGSEKGFKDYLGELKKASAERLKEKLAQEMVEEPAPLFALKNLKGETVSLEALKGKVVVLDLWATWCGPCKASFPAMQKAANYFAKDKDVEFLFINTLDNKKNLKEIVSKYMADNQYNFNVLFDQRDEATKEYFVMNSYKAKGIPAKFIIDKAGNIRFKLVGFSGSDEETVEELKAMVKLLQ